MYLSRYLNNIIKYRWLVVYLFLLPINWFAPTGMLLREFGANLLSLLIILIIFLRLYLYPTSIKFILNHINNTFLLLILFGSIAFLINISFSWSDFGYKKNPYFQFFSHSLLIFLFVIIIQHFNNFFKNYDLEAIYFAIPFIAFIHLLFFLIELIFLNNDTRYFFSLFRVVEYAFDRRFLDFLYFLSESESEFSIL